MSTIDMKTTQASERLPSIFFKLLHGSAALLALGGLVGCAGPSRDLKHGMTAYESGNFHKAEARCDAIEQGELEGKKQVRYLVYCGLTYYRTGQMDTARSLLTSGQRLYSEGDPSWLKPLIVDEMNKAVIDLSGGAARAAKAPVSLSSQGVSSADDVE
jgi:hypothetical protein